MIWKELLLTPPADLELVSRSLGIRVKFELFPNEVSGVYVVTSSGRSVIGLNTGVGTPRMRFTWAHEIGHHLLSDPAPGSVVLEHLDGPDGAIERLCNTFAANLLMPAGLVSDLVQNTRGRDVRTRLRTLRSAFGVSSWAIHRRLEELELEAW